MSAWSESTSGGTVRTIVGALLVRGDIAEAVMTCSSGLGAETIIIKNNATPIPSTCYSFNRSLTATLSSLPQKTRRVVVALPCQARKIREMAPSTLIISPVCFETVREEAIMKGLVKCGLSLEESEIKSVYRRHNELLVQTQEKLLTVPFKRFWSYLKFFNFRNAHCVHCRDHFGESSDIVVWDDKHRSNLVRVRTIAGLLALSSAAHMLEIKRDRFFRGRLGFLNISIRQKVLRLLGMTLYRNRG